MGWCCMYVDGTSWYDLSGQPTSYPQTGTSWYDLSGNNNNGTLIKLVLLGTQNGWFILMVLMIKYRFWITNRHRRSRTCCRC
jgi:hypothetical protein